MSTSLYRLFDESGRLLYVGISGNPGRRFSEHSKGKSWWTLVSSITLEHFSKRESAELVEQHAIKSESPVYNKRHANDAPKVCPYGCVDFGEDEDIEIGRQTPQEIMERLRAIDAQAEREVAA